MQGLLRLAGWGVAALAALLLGVIAANSGAGRERLAAAFAGVNGTRAAETAKADAAQAALLARTTVLEGDTRRLIEKVRSLAGDRERLMARVSVIERGLEDVTGSIQRQAAAATATTPPAPPTPVEPPARIAAAPAPAAAPPAPVASTASLPPARPEPNRAASVGPPRALPELEAIQPRAAGVDIGSASSFDGLRALWSTITATHPDLFEGLHPIVTVRENSKSRAADLRLIAGPLTDVESASRICSTLAAAKRYCRLVAFEGQPLALNAPEPARRPPPAAKARPVARPAP